MPDPFDSFKTSSEGPVDTPLPAAEVRRRGDRLRRRRTGVRALGAAMAVAVVATGGVALGMMRPDTAPQPPPASRDADPTPAPTPDPEPTPTTDDPATTEIPARFPIAAGYPTPAPGSDDQELVGPGPRVRVLEEVAACERLLHPTTDPADRLAVLLQQPEDFRSRELTTYPDVRTARAVLSTLVTGHRDCPRESDSGTPESLTLTDVRQTGLGDEGYVVVSTYEVGGDPATGLGQIHVVRVGNAVLISTTSNEAGSEPDSVDAEVRSHSAALRPVVAAMCAFSGRACEDDPAGELAPHLMSVSDLRSLTTRLATTWETIAPRSNPTLDCQADWLGSLQPDERGLREFRGRGSDGTVNAEAATAIMGFPDEAAAAAAFDVVSGWVRSCDEQMPGTRSVSTSYDWRTDTADSGADEVLWRVFEGPAPEICLECDVRWIDVQGVARVGARVVVLSVGHAGEGGSGADAAAGPIDEGLALAARLAAS